MKKLVSLIVVISMIGVLSACRYDEKVENEKPTPDVTVVQEIESPVTEKEEEAEVPTTEIETQPSSPEVVLQAVFSNEKFGYVNANGEMVIQPQFDRAEPFSEGLALVMQGSRVGYIDESGKYVINPKFNGGLFEYYGNFSDGLATVFIDSKFGYLDKTGEMVIPLQFAEAQAFSEGLAGVCIEKADIEMGFHCGFINNKGEIIINYEFDNVTPFKEGFASVWGDGHWGFINKEGEYTIKPQFDYVYSFSEGLAAVQLGDKWGYVNENGEFVIQAQYDYVFPFAEGLGAVCHYKEPIDQESELDAHSEESMFTCGFINKNGETVIEPKIDYLYSNDIMFSEGLAAIKVENDYGYIDTKGEFVVNPQFLYAEPFSQGYARVMLHEGGEALINKAGEFIWKP